MSAIIDSFPELITRDQAATLLGIRTQTLATWASTGRYALPFVKIGRRVMYRISDIQAFVESNLIMQEAA